MSDRIRVTAPEGGRLMTKQSEAGSTDINRIVDRWRKTGIMPVSGRNPQYGDFSSGHDFHESLVKVKNAERDFMLLPARIRTYCENDPAEYLDLCLNPDRRDECVDLGIKDAQLPEKALLVRMEETEENSSDKASDEA